MRGVAARWMFAGALALLCAACAPTTYIRPGTSQSQSERDLEAVKRDPLAFKDVHMACAERAIKDGLR